MPDMLKLARNPLSDLKVFVAENGEMIECRFIICTSNRKESESNMGTSFLHIHYHRYKMKVRLSAQTFSISVAFLQRKTDPDFQGVDETIKFIRVVDRLFDLLNQER